MIHWGIISRASHSAQISLIYTGRGWAYSMTCGVQSHAAEEVFNTTNINITGVAGLNDALNVASIPGFCGTCHDTPNVGNHSVKAPLNIGIADAGAKSPPALDISGLPVFTLTCMKGPFAGQIFTVTDPGRALISGQCADIGKGERSHSARTCGARSLFPQLARPPRCWTL